MTNTMEQAPVSTSPEAAEHLNGSEVMDVKTLLNETGLSEHDADQLAETIDHMAELASAENGRNWKDLQELEHTISDLALQVEGYVYDEDTNQDKRIHDPLTAEQRTLVQQSVLQKVGEEGLDWMNNVVMAERFDADEKATIQEMFSKDATNEYFAEHESAVVNEQTGNTENVNENEHEAETTPESGTEKMTHLSENAKEVLGEDLNNIDAVLDDPEKLSEMVRDFLKSVRTIERIQGAEFAQNVRDGIRKRLVESIGEEELARIEGEDGTGFEVIANPEDDAEKEKNAEEHRHVERTLHLAFMAREAKKNNDRQGEKSAIQGIAAMIKTGQADFDWDENDIAKLQDQVNAIIAGEAQPLTAKPEEAEPAEDEDGGGEAEPVGSKLRFRDKLKTAAISLMHGDIAGARRTMNPEGKKNGRWFVFGAAVGAGIMYLANKGVDINPLDGDGLDLNPFNNGEANPADVPPVDTGDAGSAPTLGAETADVGGYSEIVQPGSESGATYTMGRMFGGQLSPEQLHDVYLTAVQEKGSQGFANLMTGNVTALDAPVDQWGTVTQVNPGEVGFTGQGQRYLESVARAKGYLG